MEVRAFDGQDPPLSSTMTLNVYLRRTTTISPDVGPSFADSSYTIEVPEDATPNTTLKTFKIIKSPKQPKNLPLHCSITEGNIGGNIYNVYFLLEVIILHYLDSEVLCVHKT